LTTPSNNIQFPPYLLEQWKFPTRDIKELAHEVDLAYISIASATNNRIIGITAENFSLTTGEKWFLMNGNTYQQSLRQVYTFTAAGSIPHNLNWNSVSFISPRSYGSYTDGTNWYGAIYSSSGGITDQVTFYVTSTDIVVAQDGGAPAITSGYILLEWVSQI
jgi:hypothetical protein